MMPRIKCSALNLTWNLSNRASIASLKWQNAASRKSSSSTTDPCLINVEKVLEEPTWSVNSLLVKDETKSGGRDISAVQLHHLLRLSALPPPKDAEEEAKMLSTLSSQLHFVQEIQKIDTTGIPPLRSLRDETEAGRKESTIDLEQLREALGNEEVRGDYHRRTRRRQEATQAENGEKHWDVLGQASKTIGRYFVVKGGKEG